jgi:hypothetical protein
MQLPDEREGIYGTRDRGRDAIGRRLNSRRVFEAFLPNRTGEVEWSLDDSFGARIAVLRREGRTWQLWSPDASTLVGDDPAPRFELQGRGAMVDDRLEDRHALVAIKAGARLRCFIARAALPRRNRAGRAIRSVVDDYDAGRGGSSLATAPPVALHDPDFAVREGFLGTDDIKRTYTTYNAKPHFGAAIYVMVNTTGVYGGGIVRAVARMGMPFHEADRIGTPDDNVAADQAPVCQWVYGRIGDSRIWGWVAERV